MLKAEIQCKRFPRTFDEAFRTPASFIPFEGPYRRPRLAHRHSHWWILLAVLLALALSLAIGGAQ